MLSSTQQFKEAADFVEFEFKDTKLAVEYCIKAQDYVHALYLARSKSILDIKLGRYKIIYYILVVIQCMGIPFKNIC